MVILEVDFHLAMPEDEATRPPEEDVEVLVDRPGLKWKIWLNDAESGRSGGVYLFADRTAAERWRDELAATVARRPPVSDFQARIFDVLPEPTARTRGPV